MLERLIAALNAGECGHGENNSGLLYGDTGMAIVYSLLYRSTRDKIYEQKCRMLLDDVIEKAAASKDLSFEGGLAGVGWAIEWMAQSGWPEEIDTNDLLEELDVLLCGRLLPAGGTNIDCTAGKTRDWFYIVKRMTTLLPGKTGYIQSELIRRSFNVVVKNMEQSICQAENTNDVLTLFQLLLQMPGGKMYINDAVQDALGRKVSSLLETAENAGPEQTFTGEDDWLLYLAIVYYITGEKINKTEWKEQAKQFISARSMGKHDSYESMPDAKLFMLLKINMLLNIHIPSMNLRPEVEAILQALALRNHALRLYNGWGEIILAALSLSDATLIPDWHELLFAEYRPEELPRVLHLITGPKVNFVVERCMRSWNILKNHGYEIKIWTDEIIEPFLLVNYPFAYDAFKNARNHGEAADIARYLIIHAYGGYYMDWDVELLCVEDFVALSRRHTNGYLVIDPVNDTLAPEVFAARKHEPYLLSLVGDIVDLYRQQLRNALLTPQYSGPYRMRDSLKKHSNSSQHLIPVREMMAYDYWEIRKMPEREITQPLIHYWVHSWM